MAGVLVAIDIALDGGIHGDDTQSADYLRRVGNLALADGEMLLEVIYILYTSFKVSFVTVSEEQDASLILPSRMYFTTAS